MSAGMQVLDPALTRPGRLSRRVVVPLPDEGGRADILAVHLRTTPMASPADKDFCRRQIARISSEPTCCKLQPHVWLCSVHERVCLSVCLFMHASMRVCVIFVLWCFVLCCVVLCCVVLCCVVLQEVCQRWQLGSTCTVRHCALLFLLVLYCHVTC